MLKWLKPKPVCPVSIEEKNWIEQRFAWLIGSLGADRLKNSTLILPTTQFFPRRYNACEEDLLYILELVAEYMGVPLDLLSLQIYQDDSPQFYGMINSGTAGLYTESDGRFNIWVEVRTLGDPLAVVSTIAHEIGHVILLGEKRVSEDEPDHEELTDLLTVFLGLGIICANCVIHESNWKSGQLVGWSIGRRGYLTMDMYGYALAIYLLYRRGDSRSALSHMRPDVRAACKKGIAYIEATGDCSLSFDCT